MKNKTFIFGLITVFFVFFAASVFVLSYYQIKIEKKTEKPVEILPGPDKICGIENCHGLEITCGSNVPEACDYRYEAGDRCRQFISCQFIDGKCQLVKSPEFEKCRSCVEECRRNFPDDQSQFFACESECAQ